MKYNSKLTPAFKDKSFCYFTFPLKNKNAILYETNMTGHELVGKDYYLKRTGYYTYLFSYTLNGSAKFIYNKKEHIISKGDLVFIDCSNEHEFYPIDENWEFIYLHLNGLGLQYLYDSFINKTGFVFHNFPKKTILKELNELHTILHKFEKKTVESSQHIYIDDEIICSELSRISYNIIMDINKNLVSLKIDTPHFLSEALEYIKKNYNKNINLDDIAKAINMSKFHFERLFQTHMQTTVYQYIKELRFQKARWLLETTNMKLIEIAYDVGYSDIQALIKIFKKQLGVTPIEYRKAKFHY